MPIIKKLSPSLIAKIAAGEVIERPASAVKELIDNAIDAQATLIKVHIINAGFDEITVIDNGFGMDQDDLQKSFQQHTTSKISHLDHLHSIATFGFRGEGLHSMAAASGTLIIQSKQADQLGGYQISISNNQPNQIIPIGMPNGTVVTIRNLFSTLPARKKFLKTAQTEFRYISKVVTQYALAFPQISFVLTHNKKSILDLRPTDSNLARVSQLFDSHLTSLLLPINFTDQHLTISGFLGAPSLARSGKNHQFLFVNQRPVFPSLLSKHIRDAYGGLIEPRTSPAFFLSIRTSWDMVDVNVHPQKQKVFFVQQAELPQLITQAVKQSLYQHDITYQNMINATQNYAKIADHQPSYYPQQKADIQTLQTLKKIVTAWETTKTRNNNEVIQIHDLYLLTQTPQGILIIDQHAAHERILYEQFLEAYIHQNQKSKKLDPKISISFSLLDAQILEQHIQVLKRIGFKINLKQNTSFEISAIPSLMSVKNINQILLEIIDDLSQDKQINSTSQIAKKTISYMACRTAIKQGDSLSNEERKNLVSKLAATKTNYTCPHGRPTHIHISLKELADLFKRH